MANIIIPSPLTEKVNKSIERIKVFDPSKNGDPYYLAFSGGKDSVTVKALMDMAGVKYHAVYRHTSVDPPELVRFIRSFEDVETDYPRYADATQITMWNLIPKKLMPPTRLVRYCCADFKETGGTGNVVVTGVRWDESVNRSKNHGAVTIIGYGENKTLDKAMEGNGEFQRSKKGGWITNSDNDEARQTLEMCYRTHKTSVNPIVDWTTSEVWEFIRAEKCRYCCLYDEGFNRLGCIGCPMGQRKGRLIEFARWPTYKVAYLNAFKKMLEERERRGKLQGEMRMGKTPESVFRWWMEDKNVDGQTSLFDEDEYGFETEVL